MNTLLCGECEGKTITVYFRRMDTEVAITKTVKIGRICRGCNILYLNPKLKLKIVDDAERFYE